MEEDKIIDQSELANSVSEKIPYDMHKHFLIKPLPPVKVKKEFTNPIDKESTAKTDENGVEAVDYEVKTEVKEVDSDFRKGVVIKIPYEYQRQMNDEKWPEMPIKVGDIVIYNNRHTNWFDLLKDTQLITGYDIVAVESTDDKSKADN